MSENIPKNYKIVSVGGTGQMVMHYFLQLHMLGIIKHDFDLVVVDSDEILPSIKVARRFLGDLQYGPQKNEAIGKTRIPTVEAIQVTPTRGDTAQQVLTGDKSWKGQQPHPAHAFFNEKTLGQNLKQGLFARPALSSVLSQKIFAEEALKPRPDSTVVIVGAVTGGTGGGLTAPMLDAIRLHAKRESTPNVKIRAVLFGEYFRPKAGHLEDDVGRFQSNQTMVLRSIHEAEASEDLHSYHIIGGPGFNGDFERQPQKEQEGKNLPWPKDESNPFWQGVQAVEYLLKDTTTEKQIDFSRREITRISADFTLKGAQLRLRKALQMVSLLRKKRAVVRMCRDPWARWIWGEGLIDIASHYWSIAASKEGGKESVSNFPSICQRALESIWRGENAAIGLQDIFPPLLQRQRMRPGKMAGIRWPIISESTLARELFDDSEQIARRAAATILYWTLREVE
jgi:hypothetical protein